MKLTPRPISAADQIDQSRDITGFNKWAQSSRAVGFVMFILGWFTIPAEVLLRKDFGQRWFTVVNFYAGLLLMLIFAVSQYVIALIWGGVQGLFSLFARAINPFFAEQKSSLISLIMTKSMGFFLLAYILMGSYHLFRIWLRNRTNTALHSFDDGSSRLEFAADYCMRGMNWLAAPVVRIYMRLVPASHRQAAPKLIMDRAAFTNTVVEPVFLLFLAYWLPGIASIWLFLSAIAMAIHANWKETARQNKVLDFRDSIIEAKAMMYLKEKAEVKGSPDNTPRYAAETAGKIMPVVPQYPDLLVIIEALNRDGSHLAK